MDANGRQDNAVCPKIVSAVLKAMRGNAETPEAMASMGSHVAQCAACRERIAHLDRLVKSLTDRRAEPQAAIPDLSIRRKYRRLPTNEAVNLVFDDGSITLARMIEVSAKGARIESPEALERDTRFTLSRGRR